MRFKLDHLMSREAMIISALIIVSLLAYNNQSQKKPCETACFNQGDADFRYTFEGKHGYPKEDCTCLTKKETLLKKQILKGTKIKL